MISRRGLIGGLGAGLILPASAQVPRPGFRPGFQFLSAGSGAAGLRPQDVFATSLYTGTGGAQTITTGVDATQGLLSWNKSRNNSFANVLADTVRGVGNELYSNSANAEASGGVSSPSAFSATGYTSAAYSSGDSRVTWSFRQAPKFFKVGIFTHTNGTDDTIDLSSLGAVGMVTVKRRDAARDWTTWHRSLTVGNNLKLNTTDAQGTGGAVISVSGTTLTFSGAAPSGNYVYYAWAHDPDTTNGVVQVGTYTEPGSGSSQVTLGWRPQFLLVKPINDAGDWYIEDAARGTSAALAPNTSATELSAAPATFNSTGFSPNAFYGGSSPLCGYLVIRAPT